jgi:hypothetical protein
VVDPTPADIVLIEAAARRAGYTSSIHGARYSEEQVEGFRQAVDAVADRHPSGHMGYGPSAPINGMRVSLVDPEESLLHDLLAAVPPDALEIEVESERGGGWTMYQPLRGPGQGDRGEAPAE